MGLRYYRISKVLSFGKNKKETYGNSEVRSVKRNWKLYLELRRLEKFMKKEDVASEQAVIP